MVYFRRRRGFRHQLPLLSSEVHLLRVMIVAAGGDRMRKTDYSYGERDTTTVDRVVAADVDGIACGTCWRRFSL